MDRATCPYQRPPGPVESGGGELCDPKSSAQQRQGEGQGKRYVTGNDDANDGDDDVQHGRLGKVDSEAAQHKTALCRMIAPERLHITGDEALFR